ncbi:hypothetical protein RDV78_11305 [Bacillota bacterium LX-D]|nr:hypothetical protein [Bacillota bacterium LX-D]
MAISIPRPSLDDNTKLSATTSVYNLVGHKDDFITKPLAHNIACRTGRLTTVVGGFHLENINKAEIQQVVKKHGNC